MPQIAYREIGKIQPRMVTFEAGATTADAGVRQINGDELADRFLKYFQPTPE